MLRQLPWCFSNLVSPCPTNYINIAFSHATRYYKAFSQLPVEIATIQENVKVLLTTQTKTRVIGHFLSIKAQAGIQCGNIIGS